MADTKISQLPEATTLANGDEFVIASVGATKKVKFQTVAKEASGAGDKIAKYIFLR